jgi:hypothetical protein
VLYDGSFRLEADFILSLEVEVSAVYGEDVLIFLLSPTLEEITVLENELAGDFDLGIVAGDGSLSNIASYVFVDSGAATFIAPYSSPGVYNADKWESSGAPYEGGDWSLFIEDVSYGDSLSIGKVKIRYCGNC